MNKPIGSDVASGIRAVERNDAAAVNDGMFRAVFEHTFQLMALLAPDGTVLEVNRAALEFVGADLNEVRGSAFWETPWWRDGPDKQVRLRAAIREAVRGSFVRYEVELPGQHGRRAVFDFSLSPVHDDAGALQMIIAEGRDVAGIRMAERERRISEEKFKGIVAISSDAIISVDARQCIVNFNQGAEQTFGWAAEEVLGRSLDVLLPERFREAHRRHIERFAASPVVSRRMGERQEISGLHKDGHEFPADASISKLDVDGNRLFTVVLRDITARKRAELTQRFLAEAGTLLAQSLDFETTLRSITRLAVQSFADYCVIFESGRDRRLRRLEVAHSDASKRAQLEAVRRLPLPSEHPAIRVIESGEPELIPEVTDTVLASHAGEDADRELLRDLIGHSAILVPLVALGETMGAVSFYSSAPGRRYGADDLVFAQELALRAALAMYNARLYQEARAAVQARDDVLAVVSHDLGNPLSAIRIGTSLLLRSVPPEERTGGWKHIEGIRYSVEQMERLINDLLEVKRIEAGHMALDWMRLAPASLIDDVLDLMAPLAQEKDQQLEVDLRTPLPPVRADRERTLQVFSNLIGNAVKFTAEGGRITIAAVREADEVVFRVSDTGRGIDPRHLEHVFDRFWQAHRSNREGIGLGLAIVKGIVHAHGGRVWVQSEPNVGTTFYFTLPVATEAPE